MTPQSFDVNQNLPCCQVHGHHPPTTAETDIHRDPCSDGCHLDAGPPPGLPSVLLLSNHDVARTQRLLHRLAWIHHRGLQEDVGHCFKMLWFFFLYCGWNFVIQSKNLVWKQMIGCGHKGKILVFNCITQKPFLYWRLFFSLNFTQITAQNNLSRIFWREKRSNIHLNPFQTTSSRNHSETLCWFDFSTIFKGK